jgi:hypothetical protein
MSKKKRLNRSPEEKVRLLEEHHVKKVPISA